MYMKVIKVTKDGKVGYLHSATVFGGIGGISPIVDNPVQAKNYALPENEKDLEKDISHLRLPNKSFSAMSGVSADTAHIVEIQMTFTETSCVEAYNPPADNTPTKLKM